MGLFDKIKHQLLDVIEWADQSDEILVHRFPRYENEIKNGAKLIVRPGQRAVFVNEGKIADAFEPGTHTLSTKNLPILRTLLSWPYGFESPFKAEVYFINTTEQLDRKWGTPNPVMMRDQDFGIVRLRCRGNFSYNVGTSEEMISRFVGARPDYSCDEIEDQLRAKTVSSFSDCIAELKIPALDLAAQYDEISESMRKKLEKDFKNMGLELISFTLENISLPEEVQKAMDERASMGAIGNLGNYAQYQSSKAMREAAQNPSGAGNMMGMMVGGQLGAMAGGMNQSQQQNNVPSAAPPPLPGQVKFFVALNGQQTGPFGVDEIQGKINTSQMNRDTLVWKEGMANWTPAGQVQELAALFSSMPPPLPPQ